MYSFLEEFFSNVLDVIPKKKKNATTWISKKIGHTAACLISKYEFILKTKVIIFKTPKMIFIPRKYLRWFLLISIHYFIFLPHPTDIIANLINKSWQLMKIEYMSKRWTIDKGWGICHGNILLGKLSTVRLFVLSFSKINKPLFFFWHAAWSLPFIAFIHFRLISVNGFNNMLMKWPLPFKITI